MKFKNIAILSALISSTLVGCQTMENMAKTGLQNPLEPTITTDSNQFQTAVTKRSKLDAMAHVRSEITKLYPQAKIITYNTTSGLIQTSSYTIKGTDIPLHTNGTGNFTDAKATLSVIVVPINNSSSSISVGYHYLASKNFTLTWKQYNSNGQLELKAAKYYAN